MLTRRFWGLLSEDLLCGFGVHCVIVSLHSVLAFVESCRERELSCELGKPTVSIVESYVWLPGCTATILRVHIR